MNDPLPGVVPSPVEDQIDPETRASIAAAEPVQAADPPRRVEARRDDAVQDDDSDEDSDDADFDGDEDDDEDRARARSVRAAAAEPPLVPISLADVVSGQFDAQADSPDAPSLKRVLLPQAETPKLHKVLAQAGLGSRLEM